LSNTATERHREFNMVNMTRTKIATTCANGETLVYRNTRGEEVIEVSFSLNGEIVYQPLNWRIRLARPMYFATLKRFYRELRRHGITQRSLHHLAGGIQRRRNGGWAVGTAGHRNFQEWLSKARSAIALSRQHLEGTAVKKHTQQRAPSHARAA
jgi:biopolymer transport protein ExbB/TolQ